MKTAPAKGHYSSPEECEQAFYQAFRRGDIEAMQNAWDTGNEIVCIHPARPPLAGRDAVMRSWQDILGNSGGVEVRFDCGNKLRTAELAVHIGVEIIGAEGSPPAYVTVTNVYTLRAQGWKLQLHHAGPIHRDTRPRGAVH